MAATKTMSLDALRERLAGRLAQYHVRKGEGHIGTLTFDVAPSAVRTFKAHWTGFKIVYPKGTVILKARLRDGTFWSEGYLSASQPSWVLAFRFRPPAARGTGGPRPDDKLALEQAVETAISQRKDMVARGEAHEEELIRMEDFDDPFEALDEFFNYTDWYALRALNANWSLLGYQPGPSMGWGPFEDQAASLPVGSAIQEALKKSDIIWVTPNTSKEAVPCWFVARDDKIYVLSGEAQQIIPNAGRVRGAEVVARWKGRDAQLVEFLAAVRPITALDRAEFEELAELMVAKRHSAHGSSGENVRRWMRECVILELTPRL